MPKSTKPKGGAHSPSIPPMPADSLRLVAPVVRLDHEVRDRMQACRALKLAATYLDDGAFTTAIELAEATIAWARVERDRRLALIAGLTEGKKRYRKGEPQC